MKLQYGDDRYVVREAIGECPTKAIRPLARSSSFSLCFILVDGFGALNFDEWVFLFFFACVLGCLVGRAG